MKYKSKKITIDGITFASKAEGMRYSTLKIHERAGLIQNLNLQQKFKYLDDAGKKTLFTYIADFSYERDGQAIIEDVKGFATPTYKLKKKLIEDRFSIKIHEVK